jgi:putative transposase
MLAIAEMYVQGVSTRDAAKVMAEFGLNSLSSMQVSRAAALLDGELQAWRCRPLGTVQYLLLDARYEKVREGGVVRDAAILSAIGVDPEGRRRVLGVSAALSEAEVHWRSFLDDLVGRGLRGVRFITSDDHAGLRAKPFSPVPSGSAASFIWLKTPSTTRPMPPSAKPSAPNSAASGTPPPW